jgi:hypothetical protein
VRDRIVKVYQKHDRCLYGSGVLVDDRFVLTCGHVVGSDACVDVAGTTWPTRTVVSNRPVPAALRDDLCADALTLIELAAPVEAASAIAIGDDPPRAGTEVRLLSLTHDARLTVHRSAACLLFARDRLTANRSSGGGYFDGHRLIAIHVGDGQRYSVGLATYAHAHWLYSIIRKGKCHG